MQISHICNTVNLTEYDECISLRTNKFNAIRNQKFTVYGIHSFFLLKLDAADQSQICTGIILAGVSEKREYNYKIMIIKLLEYLASFDFKRLQYRKYSTVLSC